jgi:hypothetical protein
MSAAPQAAVHGKGPESSKSYLKLQAASEQGARLMALQHIIIHSSIQAGSAPVAALARWWTLFQAGRDNVIIGEMN